MSVQPMPSLPQMAYGPFMNAPIEAMARTRNPDSIRTFCDACEHSEFVHRDDGERACLYSVCTCEGFRKGVV
jgi:hypothetical protein